MTANLAYIDANVVLRFLIGDQPEQAERAQSLFEAAESDKLELILSCLVCAEVVWVLEGLYDFSVGQIRETLIGLLNRPGFSEPQRSDCIAALNLYAEKGVDFIDAMLAVEMDQDGVKEIYTFDKHFQRLPVETADFMKIGKLVLG